MSTIRNQLEFLANATEVERYHVVYTIQRQNIGDHSFGVAWGCWLLTGGAPSANLLMAALSHDIAEHEVGDVPATTKRRLKLRELLHEYETEVARATLPMVHGALTVEEEHVLALADSLDGLMFCYRELRLGNTRVVTPFHNFASYARVNLMHANQLKTDILLTAISMCEELLP
jgi:5'-deoxynucleotidase YfbR-like HD superfamily hydrolase